MKVIVFIYCIVLWSYSFAQKEYYGKDANKIISGAKIVYFSKQNSVFPTYVKLNNDVQKELLLNKIQKEYNIKLKLISKEKDQLGFLHYKYQQLIDTISIEWAIFSLHTKDDKVQSYSGTIWPDLNPIETDILSSEQALNIALLHHPAQEYMWNDTLEEKLIKTITGDNNFSFKPKSTLVYYKTENIFTLAYKITIYSKLPLSKKDYYIDATTGELINVIEKIHTYDVQGTANTRYSGIQTITTDLYNGHYRLRQSGRGNGIFTFNMQMGTNYSTSIDFTDDDNYWDNFNQYQDEVATDAHWATEKYYDYFFYTYNRNSIDNNGFALYNYIHANLVGMGFSNNVNAFWDGYRMTYGDGNTSYSPLTSVDIVAHEITHGLTEYTANLVYQDESGALNEAFSDIFATVVEFYAKPLQANWTIGEDVGYPFRSLADPNQFNDPDTYQGLFWDPNNQVHQNSTVYSHWFYLLSNGGNGTNDNGQHYNISGIGINNAANIAYRTLVYYLPPTATYYDARFFSIMSAIDIFGPCSPEVEATTNAMYAVGVGQAYQNAVIANFSASITQTCQAPFGVQFYNLSSNAQSFYWNFGDGNFSNQINPFHVYTDTGLFTVTLIANGGNCGSDTIVFTDYISIQPNNPCVVIMPLNGTGNPINACQGTLYDGGGPNGNYANMSDAIITISPQGADKVYLTFTFFDVEPGSQSYCDYDYVEIFDGPDTNSVSFGRFCNTTGSPGTIQSTGNSITILMHSDEYLTRAGFVANWTCEILTVAPQANFIVQPINTCSGLVYFIDASLHNPTSWFWDFGDGNTSTLQNPIHEYLFNGTYNVTLIVSNNNGTDTLFLANVVTINRPELPNIESDTICINQNATLIDNTNGTIFWYNNFADTIPFYIGDTLITEPLNQTTIFWVQNAIINPSQYVGDTRSNSDGGYFNSSLVYYLVFDCYTECELVSVEVNANSNGNRTISLLDSMGNLITSRTVYIQQGISRIPLNIKLPVENKMRLAGPPNPNLWRNSNSVAFYPYTLPGILSIKSSSFYPNPTAYYYYFYNWEVKLPDCFSAKIPIYVYVENCSFVSDINDFYLKIFPNPGNNFIQVETNEKIQALSITDIYGKNYPIKIKILDDKFIINTSFLNSGLYLLYVQINNKVFVEKVIILR